MDPATPIVLVLAALLAATGAKEDAREFARKAGVAYNLGRYEEAADLYESSYRAAQDPTLLFNIGQSYRLAGKPDRALAAYKGFLRTAPADDPNRPAVEARAAEMEKAVQDSRRAAAAPPPPAAPPPAPARSGGGSPRSSGPGARTAPAPTPPAAKEPPASTTEPASAEARTGTAVGAMFGVAGRDGHSTNVYRGYGRFADSKQRVYELGYFRVPIYPMNPAYRYSALYGSLSTAGGWTYELGALGRDGGWHMAASRQGTYLGGGLRLEGLSPEGLCSSGDARVLYAIPEGRLSVPVSSRFSVTALASYRGKLSSRNCDFRPSMLTVDISGQWAMGPNWLLDGGLGHYGLHDFGDGAPGAAWPDRDNAAELVHVGARYLAGRMALFADLRSISYNGGTFALMLGAEFRSAPAGSSP